MRGTIARRCALGPTWAVIAIVALSGLARAAEPGGPVTDTLGVGSVVSTCVLDDPDLQGPPDGLPPTSTHPIRQDPDGAETLILLVDDPADARPDVYAYLELYPDPPVDEVGPLPGEVLEELAGVEEVGVFTHAWETDRSIVTYGLYIIREGRRTRVPLFLLENVPADPTAAATMLAFQHAYPLAFNSPGFALNTVTPTPSVAALLILVPAAGFILYSDWTMHSDQYPLPFGYEDALPVYLWTTYRKSDVAEIWSGAVLMQSGQFESRYVEEDGVERFEREGCRRTRIGSVVRDTTETRYLGGAYLLDEVYGQNDANGSFEGQQTLTAGATAGTSPDWTDVPVATVHQSEEKSGPRQFGLYAENQRDEIRIGTTVEGRFIPLLGTRADASHAAPPEAQNRLVSVGVFDLAGEYHPVAGARAHFERYPGDLWVLFFALTGGPGSQVMGDWAADVGLFDPDGAFVPVVGTTYDDQFDEAQYPYQMMITAGAWAADEYHPLLGLTYDGEKLPLLAWTEALGPTGDDGDSRWLTSAGTFAPSGYAPLLGASGNRATTKSPEGEVEEVHEEYRVGVFPGTYPDFVPLAGADWRSDRSSGRWLIPVAGDPTSPADDGKATSDARVDVGPAPGGPLIPVLGLQVTEGAVDHYGVGVWAGSSFVPVLEACHRQGLQNQQGSAGLALGGGAGRVPVAWAGFGGGVPPAGTGPCP